MDEFEGGARGVMVETGDVAIFLSISPLSKQCMHINYLYICKSVLQFT